jgi:hypothetical protein
MATITAQSVVATGLTPVYSAVTGSDQFLPDAGGLIYVIKNGGGSTDNVTITDSGNSPAGNTGTNPVVAVPAAGERWIYMNPALVNANTGFITVAHSFTTSVTAGLFRGV